jgi:hypothetical protein
VTRARTPRGIVPAVILLAAIACRDKPSTPTAPPLGKALAALLSAADAARAPWRCAATDTPELGDQALAPGWRLRGHALVREGAQPAQPTTIAVVADAGGASPRTIASLGQLRARLDAAGPDLVVTLGGMGQSRDEIEATLGTLTGPAGWPVVALPGDLEAIPAHVAAIAALREAGRPVADGRLVRWIELGGATIGTVPGAGAVERLVAGPEGCAWTAEEVAGLYGELSTRPGLRIAAMAEAPRQLRDGEPAGELALVASEAQPIDLVLHGPLVPGPSAATRGSRGGARVALTPGTADATMRLPAPHTPSAGLLTLRSGRWSWQPLFAPSR